MISTGRRGAAIFAAVAILLAGCSSTGPAPSGGAGQTSGPSQHAGMPDLGLAHVTTETANARGAEIGPEGGTIMASGSNGTTYTLTIPAGAILEPVEVGLYPVTALTTLPSGASLLAGAQFSPDGLHLVIPATLTIAPPSGTDLASATGYAWTGDGANGARYFAFADGSTVSLPILHFSGAGAGSNLTGPAARACDEPLAIAGNLIDALSAGVDAMVAVLRDCYRTLVGPALLDGTDGATGDFQPQGDLGTERFGIDAYTLWLQGITWVRRLRPDVDVHVQPEEDQARALAVGFVHAWYDDWNGQCRNDAGSEQIAIGEAKLAMAEADEAVGWQIDTAANQLQRQQLLDALCVQVVVDPSSGFTGPGPGKPGTLHVLVGYSIAGGPVVHGSLTGVLAGLAGGTWRGLTDGSGVFERDIDWPPDADSVVVSVVAGIVAGGQMTDIVRETSITGTRTGSTPPPQPTETPEGPGPAALTVLTRVSGVSPCPGGGPSCSFEELGPWTGSGSDSSKDPSGLVHAAGATQTSDVEVNADGLILRAVFSGTANGSNDSGSSRLNLDFTLAFGAAYTIKGEGSGMCFEIGLDGLDAEGGAVPIFDQENCGSSSPISSTGTLPAGSYHYVVKLDSGGSGSGDGKVTLEVSP